MNEELYTALLVKSLSGNASKDERTLLEAEWESNERRLREFEELKRLWEVTGEYEGDVEIPDTDIAFSRFESVAFNGQGKRDAVIRPLWVRVASIAAVALVLITALMIWNDGAQYDTVDMVSVTSEEMKKMQLPDGSVIELDEGSTITYSLPFEQREVTLEGRALFDVQHLDEDSPFVVFSKGTRTTVLGTVFTVDAIDGKKVAVYVEEGKVAFESNDRSEHVLLTKGNQGSWDDQTRTIEKSEIDDTNIMSWQSGILNFDNERMEAILPDLERHYGVRFTVENEEILDCTYKAIFEHAEIEEILDELGFGLNLEFNQTSEGYFEIAGVGCK